MMLDRRPHGAVEPGGAAYATFTGRGEYEAIVAPDALLDVRRLHA